MPKGFPPKFLESTRLAAEKMLRDVMQVVNNAPDGNWISGSEEQVRDGFAVFGETMHQPALQARIDAKKSGRARIDELARYQRRLARFESRRV